MHFRKKDHCLIQERKNPRMGHLPLVLPPGPRLSGCLNLGDPGASDVTPGVRPERALVALMIVLIPILLMGGCVGVNLGLRAG